MFPLSYSRRRTYHIHIAIPLTLVSITWEERLSVPLSRFTGQWLSARHV
jgi:hypothetical protein